jgi:hypothetical protein
MKWRWGFILAALLCGGCTVYADPYPPPSRVYVAPPPAVVVEPGWENHYGWYHEGWHHRRYWRG